MTFFRPIAKTTGPLYAYVPIERVRPSAVPKMVEIPPPPAPKRKERNPLFRLLGIVSHTTGISVIDILSSSRKRPIVRARFIFWVVAREATGKSMPALGRACGGRDHSTVMHGIQRVAENAAYYEPELSAVRRFFPRKTEKA